jgi:tetratricopeptide (TPR) repeat protein
VPRRRWLAAGAAIAVAAGLLVAVRGLARGEPRTATTAAAGEHVPQLSRSVAVLPLADETGRAELAWLGDALAERMGEALALAPGVRVVAAGRVTSAVDELGLGAGGWSPGELGRVADLFGVDRVVAGAVRGTAERLWVELRLADRAGEEVGASRVEASGGVGDLAGLAAALTSALRARLELVSAGPAAPSSASPAAYAAFAEGSARLAAGDAAGAGERLEAAVAADPAFAAAWLRLGLALEAAGRDEPAIAAVERAVAAAPAADRRLTLEVRASQARLAGDPETARRLLAELAALHPDDVELAIAAGEAAGELGDGAAAESALSRAVALDPQHPRAWFLRAKYAILSGRAREAVDDYLVRALVLHNKLRHEQGRADVLNAFGVAYKRLGELERAEEHFRQAAELRARLGDRRGHATTLRNLASIAAIRGDFSAAESRLAEALAVLEELGDRAGIADLHNERGVLEEERGRAAAALDDYRRALELRRRLGDQRGLAESQNNVGYAYFLLGEYDHARAYWQQALTLQRTIGDEEGAILTAQSVAQLDLAQGRWREAARDLLQSLEGSRRSGLEPAAAVALGGLGRLALYEGRFAAALSSFGEALELLRRIDDPRGLAEFTLAEAETWLELGLPARAAERLADAEAWLESGNHEQRAEHHALHAATLARLARVDAAQAALASGRDEAGASGSRVAALRLDLAAGEVALAGGRPAAARAPFAAAARAAAELDHAWLELHAREGMARAALAAADPAAARGELLGALRRAERCGLYGGRWRLHALLAASHAAGGDEPAAEDQRAAARRELERLLAAMAPEMRSEFERGEVARELG